MAAVGASTGGVTAGGVRAGLAYVELIARDKIGPVLDKVHKKLAGLGSALTRGGAASLGAGVAVLAPIVAMATAGADRFDRMANEAKKLDLPIDQFYRLSTAAEIAGVSIEQLAEDPSKYAAALAMVGDAPVEAIEAAAAASREWRATLVALKEASAGVLADLVPLAKMIAAFVRENKEAVKVAALVGTALAALGIGAIALGSAFGAVALAVAGLKAVLFGTIAVMKAVVATALVLKTVFFTTTAVVAVFAAIKAAILALLSPVGLIVAAIAGLGYLFVTHTQTGQEMGHKLRGEWVQFKELLGQIGDTFKETWGGIVAAVRKGDLEQAFEVACAGIKVAWFQLIEWLTRKWGEFKNTVADNANWLPLLLPGPSGNIARLGAPLLRNNPATDEGLRGARLDLARARRELNRAVQAAQAPWTGPDDRSPSSGDLITSAMMARVRGAFYGPLGQQLGAGNQFQRDLLRGIHGIEAAAETIEAATEEATEILRRVLAFQ